MKQYQTKFILFQLHIILYLVTDNPNLIIWIYGSQYH